MPKLKNQRWERYAQARVRGLTQHHAYIKAGYKARGDIADQVASRLSRNAKVEARIEELNSEIERQAIADGKEVREILTRILRQELTEDTIAGKDPVRFETRPNAASIVRAVKTLGDLEGWFGHGNTADDGELDAIAVALARTGADRAVN